jgi:hypothetical protein
MGTGLALVFLVQCLNHDETSVSLCLRPRDNNETGQASIERLRSIGALCFFQERAAAADLLTGSLSEVLDQ